MSQVAPNMVVFGGAGGRVNEGRLQMDGISVGTAFNGAGVSAYVADVNNAQEIVLTASGGMGEAEVGGPTLNIVPKEGGNTAAAASSMCRSVTEGMVGSNYTQELKDRGLTTPGACQEPVGLQLRRRRADREGPPLVLRHRCATRAANTVPGMFANVNAGDPTKWTYVPDRTGRPLRPPRSTSSRSV